MTFDLAAFALLALLVLAGVVRGALAAGFALLAMLGAYAAAVVFAPACGPAVAEALALPSVLGVGVAGAGLFLAAFLAIGVLGAALRAVERRQRGDEPRGAADRALGGFFGLLRGGLLVGLLAYAMVWLDAWSVVSGAGELDAAKDSTLVAATQTAVENAAGVMMDDGTPGGRLAARAAAHPAETFGALQALLEDPRVQELRSDVAFWAAVEQDEVDGALNRVSFVAIAYNQELRHRFAEFGLVDAAAAQDPAAFRGACADALGRVGPRLRELRRDPELQRLARDPEVAHLLQSGDTLGLLRHPGFRRLVDRIASGTG